jgi:UDP-N-acetylglucosamine 2-epimerase (non-hydrolysing)
MGMKRLSRRDLKDEVAIIMGTRPGIVKMAPLEKEFAKRGIPNFLLHTGQHYSSNMDGGFFSLLELPQPEHRVEATKNYTTHAEQTAEMLRGVEEVLLERKPKVVLVCGDANTNLAAGLAARKIGLIVGHVESGLRSNDWSMPEEHNRIILDHICELLFAPTVDTCRNLVMDNVKGEIHLTGNTIVDSTLQHLALARKNPGCVPDLGLKKDGFFLFTCHREENVDVESRLLGILEGVSMLADQTGLPVIYPVHPRTRKRLDQFGVQMSQLSEKLRLLEPLGYFEALNLIADAAVVLTDSGGIQEESCVLNSPCITLRDNTERPETLAVGSNMLVGTVPQRICDGAVKMMNVRRGWEVPFGDGRAAARIADVVVNAMRNGAELVEVGETVRYNLGETFVLKEIA